LEKGIQVDESKFEVLKRRPVPTSIMKVRKLPLLGSFYYQFSKDLSLIMAFLTKCKKKG